MPLRSITVVQSINSLLPFIAEQYSTVWMYHSFLTHHLLEDILVKVGSVTNKNVKKICVQIKKINWSPNLIIPKAYTISVCVCVCVCVCVVCMYVYKRENAVKFAFLSQQSLDNHWLSFL